MTNPADAALASPLQTPAPGAERYVINLCSSTTPMALVQPKAEPLCRFSFFVSRRREDGRERFRLHMGYFDSPETAEQWLSVVRDLYPAAWVGEAPGKRLPAARAAAQTAPAAPAPTRSSTSPSAASRGESSMVSHTVAPAALGRHPVVSRAPVPTPRAPASVAAATPVAATLAAPSVTAPSSSTPVAPTRAAPTPRPPAPAAQPPAPRAPTRPTPSNVAEVIASLGASNIPTVRPAAPAQPAAAPRPPALPALPTRRPVAPRVPGTSAAPAAGHGRASHAPTAPRGRPPLPRADAPQPAPAPAPVPPDAASMSDTQVLRMLERRGPADGAPASPEASAANEAIHVLRPDDTQTMQALRRDVVQDAPVQFAVQLEWSVTAIDLAKVPPLAIFSAYTLYTIESSREGRRWYGLRLGFFSDAISAKQVAYYVRSDFASVAVVPVTVEEKSHATRGAHAHDALGARAAAAEPVEEFKLFGVDEPPPPRLDVPKPAAVAPAAPKEAAPKVRGRPKPARERSITDELEQTLEILGAADLQIDNGRGELLNDSGVRHLSVKVDKRTSTFSKLLERLSDRVGKD